MRVSALPIYLQNKVGGAIQSNFLKVALLVYVVMSVVTFIAYAIDKSSAKNGAWRTSEKTLHWMAFACGWPGAWLGQQLLRHKSSKPTFRWMFFMTIVANILVFAATIYWTKNVKH